MKNNFSVKISSVFLLLTFLFCISSCTQNEKIKYGLIGIYYSELDMTSIKAVTVLESLEQTWDESVDFQGESSGEWNGYIYAPATDTITFYLSTNWIAEAHIAGEKLKVNKDNPEAQIELQMTKGQSYPVTLFFWHTGGKADAGSFSLQWSWADQERQSIPLEHIYYTDKESSILDFLKDIDPEDFDKSQYIYPEVQNVIVYYEPGRFAAWPANAGIWNWGDEILVGFLQAYNQENKYHHAINKVKSMNPAYARSLDGGLTWTLEKASENLSYGKKPTPFKGTIDFSKPGFALRNRNESFYFSYDKGHTWDGPFAYPDLGKGELTSRTDYIVENSNECFVFTSVKDKRVRASLQDRAVCIKTNDGGKNFEFIGWMSELDTVRSVMPATVRVTENHLISAMRRRLDPPKENKYGLPQNWIDVYESFDNGKNWQFLHKIANTDSGIKNGNPPSMVRLDNGHLCVVYGYRGIPYSIRSRVSSDNGKSWSKEIILRDDARIWDIGYLRSVVRADGQVVSVYYFSTEQHSERHIAATIWDPNKIDETN